MCSQRKPEKNVRRERGRDLPANPSLADLGPIPDEFRTTDSGDNFVIYDSTDDEDVDERVIVFGTRRNINLLAKSHTWFLDGTFKTSPNIFTQIFVIMGIVTRPAAGADEDPLSVTLPFVYSFLTSKTTEAYEAVLRSVKEAAERQEIANVTPTLPC